MRVLLLLKAEGQYKHSGKYYLLNGHWHLIGPKQQAPKGAPVSAHPHAAGQHAPAKHFTDEEWDKLKLPDHNVNAGTYNKQLEQLKQHSEAGHVAGILGSGYGTNTYGKKLSTVANHLLKLHGSEHQVTPGQKAGEHHAVQHAPAEPAPETKPELKPEPPKVESAPPKVEDAAPKVESSSGLPAMPQFEEGKEAKGVVAYYEKKAKHVLELAAAGDIGTLNQMLANGMIPNAKGKVSNTFAGKTKNSKMFLQMFLDAQKHAKTVAAGGQSQPEAPQKQPEPVAKPEPESEQKPTEKPAQGGSKLSQIEWGKLQYPEQLKDGSPNKQGIQANKKIAKIKQLAEAGDIAALEAMTFGTNTYAKIPALAAKTAIAALKESGQAEPVKSAEPVQASTEQGPKDGDTKAAAGGGTLVFKNGRWHKQAEQKAAAPEMPKPKGMPAKYAYSANKITIALEQHDINAIKVIAGDIPDNDESGQHPIQKYAAEAIDYIKQHVGTAKPAMPELSDNYYKEVAQKIHDALEQNAFYLLENLHGQHSYPQTEDGKKVKAYAIAAMNHIIGQEDQPTKAQADAAPDTRKLAEAFKNAKPKEEPEASSKAPTPEAFVELSQYMDSHSLYDSIQKLNEFIVGHGHHPAAYKDAIDALYAAGHKDFADKFKSASIAKEKLEQYQQQSGKPAAKTQHDFTQWLKDGAPTNAAIQDAWHDLPNDQKEKHQEEAYGAETMMDAAIMNSGSASEAKAIAEKYLDKHGHYPGNIGYVKAALKSAGYNNLITEMFGADGDGPKDGDTKPAADGGTLVFKDGHWHKQEQPKVAADPKTGEQQHPIDAVPEPDLSSLHVYYQEAVSQGIKNLKQAVKDHGPAALNGIAKNIKGKLHTKVIKDNGSPVKIIGYESQPDKVGHKLYNYVMQLKAAAGKPKKASKPKTAAPKGPQPAGGIQPMDHWEQTGPQGGSNPGGKFKDENGVEWYCKFPADEDTAKAEVLAAKLYGLAGVTGQDAKLITKNGKLGIASKWVEVTKATPAKLAKTDGVLSGFAVDAWLGNWDVVGLGYDNLQVGADGKAVRVDAGGSLMYRAQGGKKAFGDTVPELDSLKDPSINPQAAKVFGGMSEADLLASVAKVVNLSDSSIMAAVMTSGYGTFEDRQKLAATLIARKKFLAEKYPQAVKKKKVQFKPEEISAPPDFLNWGNSGKSGPSSKEFLNQANHQAAQDIYAAAKTGDAESVKNLKAPIYNKDTGDVTGSAAVLEHPSQHIKGYAQQVINEINYQMNPPKKFRFEGGHPLHALNAAYPPHTGPLSGDKIAKVGKYVALGEPGVFSPDVLGLPKITHKSGQLTQQTYAKQAQAAIAKMPATQRQAVKAYTGSGYHQINSSLWEGNPSGQAKAAAEALHTLAHDIEPGTLLSRKLSLHGSDLQNLLGSTGKILQEPAIMSTSIRPSSWSGNVQLKLTVGPGVKGLWVGYGSMPGGGALSNHAGEDEMVLPPNTRIMIVSVKNSSGTDADGFGGGVNHVIEAVILPSEGY